MPSDFHKDYADEQLRRSRQVFRRVIKSFYLRNTLKYVIGTSIDFGCGAGQLLDRLPPGSVGVEVNPFLIKELVSRGLNVIHYRPEEDKFALLQFPKGTFSTLLLIHILEHFTDPAQILRTLLRSCRRIGIKRVILVLPGWKGYLSDHTHKTFVDIRYLKNNGLLSYENYHLKELKFFPGNKESYGRHFIYHEMIVVLDRAQ